MWAKYFTVASLPEALEIFSRYPEESLYVAGATDLFLEMERGLHKDKPILIDLSRITGLDSITQSENGDIHIGALVSHNQVASSQLLKTHARCLVEACYQVGSPQIRNRGTIAGNLVTASPANDTIPALVALDAELHLVSQSGERDVKVRDFYTGVRRTILKQGELVREIIIREHKNSSSAFYKLALRNAQAISLVNAAVVAESEEEGVSAIRIAVGAVAPTIVRLITMEKALAGKNWAEIAEFDYSSRLEEISPIDDIRSSSLYRREMASLVVKRCLESIHDPELAYCQVPDQPVTLEGRWIDKDLLMETHLIDHENPIQTTINGRKYEFFNSHRKNLLDLIREDAKLTGSKEGCKEGECGACTVYLDGKAVMSCLVPAPRAHMAHVETIEGISPAEHLHPVQEAFISAGAVQCGYCTPGFVMSGVKLLEEKPHPDTDEIKQAFAGNLCRCTGYYKIIKAIEIAANGGNHGQT